MSACKSIRRWGWEIEAELTGGLLVLHITDQTGSPVEVAELQGRRRACHACEG